MYCSSVLKKYFITINYMNQIYESQHGTYSTDMKHSGLVFMLIYATEINDWGLSFIIYLSVNSVTKL